MRPDAGPTDTTARIRGRARCAGASPESSQPPTPDPPGLDDRSARSRRRATLVPPQTLLCTAHPWAGARAVLRWAARAVPRGQRDALPERAFFPGPTAGRRPGAIERMHPPEVYRGLSPGTSRLFL